MSNDFSIIPFSYEGNQIRVFVDERGNVEFVATDVCVCLDQANPSQAISRLDEDEKGFRIVDTPGGPQQVRTVKEPGLYTLVLTSRTEKAKGFKRWITHDVIPSIRQTGGYSIPGESNRGAVARTAKAPTPRQICSAYDLIFGKVLNASRLAVLKFDGVTSVHPALEGPLLPGLAALPAVAVEDKLYSVTEIGLMLAERMKLDKPLSAMKLNKLMHGWGLQEPDVAGGWKPLDGPARKFADYEAVQTRPGTNVTRKERLHLKWKEGVVGLILPLAQEALV